MKKTIIIVTTLLSTTISWGQSNSFPETGDVSINNANIKIDKVNGKGIKFYQEDANRFGQVLLEKGSGTGDGTKNTLLIEAGNTYGSNYGQRILFKTADADRLVIEHDGKVGIGTTSPDAELAVRGTIHTQEVKVDMNGWVDFVFKSDYELRTLEEVEEHINEKGHLPEIPNEEEVKENGINLGEMNAKLLQKIEELTLYMIDMNKQLKSQSKRMVQLEQENSQLKRKVSDLKNE